MPSSPTVTTQNEALARGILESHEDGQVVLAVDHSDYRLHLVPTVPPGEIDVPVGKRIQGIIEARALRMHAAHGGGRFIEPVWGAPRIVAGEVLAVEPDKRRVLVDVSVPIWVTAPANQDFSVIREGELVNFYIESGATFRPVVSHQPSAADR